jgi:hypothetical protein
MKEVPKKHLPEVSGGEFQDGGCIPIPGEFPGGEYPRNPFNPIEVPRLDSDPTQT